MDQERRPRLVRVVGITLGLLAALAVLLWIRPKCPILSLTGLYCPGCGGQRMIVSALHGDLPGAFGYNPFLFVALPLLALYGLAEAVRYVRGKPALARRRAVRLGLAVLAVGAVVFMVLRNLPGLEFLHP